jgi:hypothetical protein
MNTITISAELLSEHGYNRWSKSGDCSCPAHLNGQWQKRITDQKGETKYFITINESFGWNPNENYGERFHNWWPSIQFNVDVPNFGFHSVEISLVQWFNESGQYSQITIPIMEEMFESFFQKMDGKNYD